ncbi:hypothetical protein [Tateyamaria sp. SN6-1]|uniref:hypothetical protein n=1 Tax=Tateyamaria sp. SN6-1 TaxID=3092148 RepID=UPI0039F50658
MNKASPYLSAFKTYWRVYGGWKALLLSPYFLFSLLFSVVLKPIWYDQFLNGVVWSEWALPIIPSMIAFSLAAMAIFLAISNDRFLKLLREGGKENSYLMKVMVAFFHFIFVQFFALGGCLLFVAFPSIVLSAIGFAIFIYALSCGIAAAAALLDVTEVLNALGILDEFDDG